MVQNILSGSSKILVLLWAVAAPGIWGLPVKLARRDFRASDYGRLEIALRPSDEHALRSLSLHPSNEPALQSSGIGSPFHGRRLASGRTVGSSMSEMHSAGQRQFLVADGAQGFYDKEAHITHSASSSKFRSAGAKFKSENLMANTSFRMKGSGSIDGFGTRAGDRPFGRPNFFAEGIFRTQPLPDHGVNPTHPLVTGTQSSFSNARPSGLTVYDALPAGRARTTSQLSSQPVAIIESNIEAPKVQSSVVITGVTNEQSRISHQNRKPTVSEEKEASSSGVENDEDKRFLAPLDKTNSFSRAIMVYHPSHELSIIPHEGSLAPSKTAIPSTVDIHRAGKSKVFEQTDASGSSESSSTRSHELNMPQMKASSSMDSSTYHGKYEGRRVGLVTEDRPGPSHIENENSLGSRGFSQDQALLEYRPPFPLLTGTQDFLPTTPPGGANYKALPQKYGTNSHRQHSELVPNSDAAPSKSSVVITDVTNEMLPSHQNRKFISPNKQVDNSLEAENPEEKYTVVEPPDETNVLGAIINLPHSDEPSIMPYESSFAHEKAGGSRQPQSFEQADVNHIPIKEIYQAHRESQITKSEKLKRPGLEVESIISSSISHKMYKEILRKRFSPDASGPAGRGN